MPLAATCHHIQSVWIQGGGGGGGGGGVCVCVWGGGGVTKPGELP